MQFILSWAATRGIVWAFITSFIVGCASKVDTSAFIFVSEATPSAPSIILPTKNSTFGAYSPNIHIVGCFNAECTNVSELTVQATGGGTLVSTPSGFSFDTTMSIGETRVFSFTQTNAKGDVSPSATLTVVFEASFDLSPSGTMFLGGTSGSVPATSGGHELSFMTSLPFLTNTESTTGNFILSSGALNPQ